MTNKKVSLNDVDAFIFDFDGVLTNNQINLLKMLGFKYVAYEHTHPNSLSKNMLNRKQTWSRFLYILIKKLSNNFFRGIRHHFNYLVN